MPTSAKFDGSNFELGDFTTANRYIRQVADPADARLAMVEGPSLALVKIQGFGGYAWRFKCGSFEFPSAPEAVFQPLLGTSRLIAL